MVIEDYGELMFLQTILKKLGFDVDSTQNPRSFSDHVLTMNPDVLVMTAYGKRVHGVELSKNLRRARGLPRTILLRNQQQIVDAQALADAWLESPVAAVGLLDKIAELCGLNKQVLSEKFQKLRMQEIEDKSRILKTDDKEQAVLEKSDSAKFELQKSQPHTPQQTTFKISGGKFPESGGVVGSGTVGGGPEAPINISGTVGADPATNVSLQPTTMAAEDRRERYKKFLEEKPPKEHSFAVKQVVEHVKSLRREENKEALADLERERKEFVQHLFRKKA